MKKKTTSKVTKPVNPNTYYRFEKITAGLWSLYSYNETDGEVLIQKDLHRIVFAKFREIVKRQKLMVKEVSG